MKTCSKSTRIALRVRLVTYAVALLMALGAVSPVHAQSSKSVNINTADASTLETLPGVTPTVAQHIIDGRPYHSITDLEKAKGVGKTKADALKEHITFSSSGKSSKSASNSESKKSSSTASNGKVNVNTADLATLETLPGVGASTAQKIVDGRPYTSYSQLEQAAGLSKSKVDGMRSQITLGSTAASTSKSKKAKSSSSTAASSETENNSDETASTSSSKSSSGKMTPTGHSSGKLAPGEKIDINTASAEELDKLYGIGPSKAQAIIDYRNEHGSFQTPEDIMKVNGIKQGEFDSIKDNITVR